MKYEIQTDLETFTFEWDDADRQLAATINGESVQFRVSEPETGIYMVFLGTHVFEVRTVDNGTQSSLDVLVKGEKLMLRIVDPRHRKRGSITVSGKVELKATMPGRVVDLLCHAGDEVAINQGVLVLEAMKMQNEVRSPKAGRVTDIRVSPGQKVEAGVLLAVIE